MCKIRVSQANSCQGYFLSASVTPTSMPAAQRRLNGMKCIVNSRIPEGLPLRSNKKLLNFRGNCLLSVLTFPAQIKRYRVVTTQYQWKQHYAGAQSSEQYKLCFKKKQEKKYKCMYKSVRKREYTSKV